MKNILNLFLAILILGQFGCVKDPFQEFEEGDWNNERSILDIRFENQVGVAEITTIDASTGEIKVEINVTNLPDLSNIVIDGVAASYGAEISAGIGDALNFENASNSAEIKVTSPTGITRSYTIIAEPFVETFVGTYEVTNLVVLGGTGPEWGGGAVLPMTDKPWIWPETGGPQAELDNTIAITLDSITPEGNTFGTITNNAGPDEMYADFQYVLDPPTDVNNFYRKIPKGEGTWLRNYTTNTITFTFADGTTTSGALVTAGTEEFAWDNGYSNSKTTENYALAFNLEGTDDWDNIYTDYDKFVRKPRRYWIDLTKQE